MAQPDTGFSTQDLQLIQQSLVANLSVHPCFIDLANRHIPKDAATKSELAQIRKYANQGSLMYYA